RHTRWPRDWSSDVCSSDLPFSKTGLLGLTPGPIWGSAPSPSTDGKKLFFIGWQPRTEPIRYDLGLKRFVPFLSGISTDALYFTRDGQDRKSTRLNSSHVAISYA